MSYAKALEMGKKIMLGSPDAIHDDKHAQRVERHAFKIFEELRQSGFPGACDVTEEQIRLTAWWHDCFKASQHKVDFVHQFSEGIESEKILRQRLSKLISAEDLEAVARAVRFHAGFDVAKYPFRYKRLSALERILIEADALDWMYPGKYAAWISNSPCFKDKFIQAMSFFLSFFIPTVLKTAYAKKAFRKARRDYYRFWLTGEKMIVKMWSR